MSRLLDHYQKCNRILDQEQIEQNIANLKNVTPPCQCAVRKRERKAQERK